MRTALSAAADHVRCLKPARSFGRVAGVRGMLIEIDGLHNAASIGARVAIERPGGMIEAEVTGLERSIAHCLPFTEPSGIAVGARALLAAGQMTIRPCQGWLGRMVDGLGRPMDGHGALPVGPIDVPVRGLPPPAATRGRVGGRIETGVRAIDLFTPLCRGQRLGLFAGSGVGKSVLLSMLARWADADVAVIGLIGERGREVREFIEDDLGRDGFARSVVVTATSDSPALMRRQAAWTTLAVAEYFRDQGAHVLCLMDSVTRFAMAQREIGLANGEPPASKGYTPTVFAELPRLLERAGPGEEGGGAITGLFSVLVDGGDHDEPIADAVRGILDGHVVMDRAIAERGRFPAIDLLKSVSRSLPHALEPGQNGLRIEALRQLSGHADMADLARLGAYERGTDAAVDRALDLGPRIERLVMQGKDDRGDAAADFAQLAAVLDNESDDRGGTQ